jgi:hypothetical protein
MVLDRYEKAMVVECHLPCILQLAEDRHPGYTSHYPKHTPQIHTLNEVQCGLPLHLYNNAS